jgi:hypothetical protein
VPTGGSFLHDFIKHFADPGAITISDVWFCEQYSLIQCLPRVQPLVE